MNIKESYEKHQKEINEKLTLLQAKLKEHHLKFENNPTDWGFVGDIAHINQKLDEII
jgi:hypothetical protein